MISRYQKDKRTKPRNTENKKRSFGCRRAGKQLHKNYQWNEDQRHYLIGRDWQNRRSPLDAVTVSHSRTGARHRDSIRGTLIFRDPVACHNAETILHPLNLHPQPSFDDRYPALIFEPQTQQLHMCISHCSQYQRYKTWRLEYDVNLSHSTEQGSAPEDSWKQVMK